MSLWFHWIEIFTCIFKLTQFSIWLSCLCWGVIYKPTLFWLVMLLEVRPLTVTMAACIFGFAICTYQDQPANSSRLLLIWAVFGWLFLTWWMVLKDKSILVRVKYQYTLEQSYKGISVIWYVNDTHIIKSVFVYVWASFFFFFYFHFIFAWKTKLFTLYLYFIIQIQIIMCWKKSFSVQIWVIHVYIRLWTQNCQTLDSPVLISMVTEYHMPYKAATITVTSGK